MTALHILAAFAALCLMIVAVGIILCRAIVAAAHEDEANRRREQGLRHHQ